MSNELVYCVVQEGGTSEELYLSSHESKEAAEDYQLECAEDAGYRTTDVIEIPKHIADQPDFWECAEALVRAHLTLD